jgi:hypothetical protein
MFSAQATRTTRNYFQSGHLHPFSVWPLAPVFRMATRTCSIHSYVFTCSQLWLLAPLLPTRACSQFDHSKLFSVWQLAPVFSPDSTLLFLGKATRTCPHPGYSRLAICTCSQPGHSHMFSDWPLAPVPSLATHTSSQSAWHSHMFSDWPFAPVPSLATHTSSQSGHSHCLEV